MSIQKEIDAFIEKYTKMWFYESLAASYKNSPLLDYHIGKDGSVLWHIAQTAEAWEWWQEAKAQAVLQNSCMINQVLFMKGSPVSALVKHTENTYKAEAVAQNSKGLINFISFPAHSSCT